MNLILEIEKLSRASSKKPVDIGRKTYLKS